MWYCFNIQLGLCESFISFVEYFKIQNNLCIIFIVNNISYNSIKILNKMDCVEIAKCDHEFWVHNLAANLERNE